MGIALYGLVKFAAYSAWCYFGLRRSGVPLSRADRLGRSVFVGMLRWLLGLILGVLLFFLVPVSSQSEVVPTYLAVYVPVRVLEWWLVGLVLLPRDQLFASRLRLMWIAGGIVISFATDFTSPEMLEFGRFCVGRCLC